MGGYPWDGGSGSSLDADAGLEHCGTCHRWPPKRFRVSFSCGHCDDAPVPRAVSGVEGDLL
eukprot:14661582-Heterocapsa_arctica.AAC.1